MKASKGLQMAINMMSVLGGIGRRANAEPHSLVKKANASRKRRRKAQKASRRRNRG